MLYELEIENFYSIGHRQLIDLRARKSVEDALGRLSPTYVGSESRAANVVALFGPNASGKSNVLRAIAFGVWFVTRSFDVRLNRPLPYEKFESKEKIAKETRLSFSFSGQVDFLDESGHGPQCPYSYELVLSPRGDQSDSVLLERLSYQPNGKGKPTTIVERRGCGSIKFARGFITSSIKKSLAEVLRPQVSILATLAQLNHKVSAALVESIMAVQSNIFIERIENDDSDMVRWYASHPNELRELQAIAKRIDLGIEKIDIGNTASEPQLLFHHSGLDHVITLHRESHGTRQFIKVFPYILAALSRGGVVIIDELDVAIHPLLLPEMLRWFGDEKKNPHGAQLWTTCHSASLLSDLTKEEVLFCEKDSGGNTSVYKLADVDRVRRSENFEAKYLGGEYGAVPVLG